MMCPNYPILLFENNKIHFSATKDGSEKLRKMCKRSGVSFEIVQYEDYYMLIDSDRVISFKEFMTKEFGTSIDFFKNIAEHMPVPGDVDVDLSDGKVMYINEFYPYDIKFKNKTICENFIIYVIFYLIEYYKNKVIALVSGEYGQNLFYIRTFKAAHCDIRTNITPKYSTICPEKVTSYELKYAGSKEDDSEEMTPLEIHTVSRQFKLNFA